MVSPAYYHLAHALPPRTGTPTHALAPTSHKHSHLAQALPPRIGTYHRKRDQPPPASTWSEKSSKEGCVGLATSLGRGQQGSPTKL